MLGGAAFLDIGHDNSLLDFDLQLPGQVGREILHLDAELLEPRRGRGFVVVRSSGGLRTPANSVGATFSSIRLPSRITTTVLWCPIGDSSTTLCNSCGVLTE